MEAAGRKSSSRKHQRCKLARNTSHRTARRQTQQLGVRPTTSATQRLARAECVPQNRPTANAATWGQHNQKCYAEMGQSGVRPSTKWVNCYVTPAAGPPAVTCNPVPGDVSGGTEEFLTNTPTMQACAEYVAQNRPTANAATWGQ